MKTTLIQEVNYLVECCLASENKTNAARRLLAASNLIRSQWELLNMLDDRKESKKILGLMGRLVLRAGELLDETQYQMLKENCRWADKVTRDSSRPNSGRRKKRCGSTESNPIARSNAA
jgi:hypothetical protein